MTAGTIFHYTYTQYFKPLASLSNLPPPLRPASSGPELPDSEPGGAPAEGGHHGRLPVLQLEPTHRLVHQVRLLRGPQPGQHRPAAGHHQRVS